MNEQRPWLSRNAIVLIDLDWVAAGGVCVHLVERWHAISMALITKPRIMEGFERCMEIDQLSHTSEECIRSLCMLKKNLLHRAKIMEFILSAGMWWSTLILLKRSTSSVQSPDIFAGKCMEPLSFRPEGMNRGDGFGIIFFLFLLSAPAKQLQR